MYRVNTTCLQLLLLLHTMSSSDTDPHSTMTTAAKKLVKAIVSFSNGISEKNEKLMLLCMAELARSINFILKSEADPSSVFLADLPSDLDASFSRSNGLTSVKGQDYPISDSFNNLLHELISGEHRDEIVRDIITAAVKRCVNIMARVYSDKKASPLWEHCDRASGVFLPGTNEESAHSLFKPKEDPFKLFSEARKKEDETFNEALDFWTGVAKNVIPEMTDE